MPVAPKPSYEELVALVVAQQEQITLLTARIAELEAALKQNSKNSSKPPSSDSPFVKPASLRKKGARRPGRPGGQPGATLEQVADPRYTVQYEPELCHSCGSGLAGAVEVGRERRRVFDLSELALEVTEHQLIARRCGCGQVCTAVAPVGVAAPVQYGARVAAVVVGLWHGQFLARERVAAVMGEVFGAPMAPGTVASMATRCAAALVGFEDAVRERLVEAEAVNFDETGFRVEAGLAWVHSASTDRYSLLMVHPKRGTVAMDAIGVLPVFTGIAQHDAWAPYDTYACDHALCGAHVLRELVAVAESGTTGRAGSTAMAMQAIDTLCDLKDLVEQARAAGSEPDPAQVATLRHRLRSAALIGVTATAARENKLMGKHNALFTRLRDRFEDYLRFTTDPRVAFDNNAAEREIRMCKLRIKVSGSMRSMRGAQEFCRIRSYLQTTKKHGVGWLAALTDAMRGIPWMPDEATA
ncbi:IS66 family transposase [Actinocrinis puniceicyclus]|uniref:IS66 family transposase n=1 Tax=Actinocrinis puniceicyclus TaxID=977794 RepID=A0A8J7WR44_9ACTN|nr:IS66 family transposase [Actinocrinis puniceicyclus]MBS2967001.1 IS66 family transposase [Actinocrinis puniceicyclus]